jgi:hypothetical protein
LGVCILYKHSPGPFRVYIGILYQTTHSRIKGNMHKVTYVKTFQQIEVAEAEKAEEEALKAERRRAILEGREPPPFKKTKIEEIQEEEWEHLSHGLAVLGSQGRKAGEREQGGERPQRVSMFS